MSSDVPSQAIPHTYALTIQVLGWGVPARRVTSLSPIGPCRIEDLQELNAIFCHRSNAPGTNPIGFDPASGFPGRMRVGATFDSRRGDIFESR